MAEERKVHRLEREREEKIARLRERGVEPYPWGFPGRVPTRSILEALRGRPPDSALEGEERRVAGRLVSLRQHGRTSFLDLHDFSGRLQLLLTEEELGAERYREILGELDSGDLIGADGRPVVSRRGEPSLRVRALTLLAKAIHPPPEKYHGLQDPEARLRRRYVDLLGSAESRGRFAARSRLLRSVRAYFDAAEFLEVETPVLVPIAGGAAAAPFTTRSNYLGGEELQLRIALELALKRLLVGGFERVYEIGHVFRNEDLDATHAPEFTMLEAYWAYADYTDMQRFLEGLYGRLARDVAEWLPDVPAARSAPELFRPPFRTIDFVEALADASGVRDVADLPRERLRELARAAGATVPDDSTAGTFLDKLFDHYVLPGLDRPTFVIDHPASTTPLAKRHRSKPGRVERFELFCRGLELGNAYTELNDPIEQERRFRDQLAARRGEGYAYDADFVEALRYGMPPSSGVGIGIDRAMMALLGLASIKDAILFLPTRSHRGPATEPAP
jgi:lysyl-tRNA synthetase, class II